MATLFSFETTDCDVATGVLTIPAVSADLVLQCLCVSSNVSTTATKIIKPRNQILEAGNPTWTSASADNPAKLRSVAVSVTSLGGVADGIKITDTQGNISTYTNLYLGWSWAIDAGDLSLDTITFEVIGATEASVSWTEES